MAALHARSPGSRISSAWARMALAFLRYSSLAVTGHPYTIRDALTNAAFQTDLQKLCGVSAIIFRRPAATVRRSIPPPRDQRVMDGVSYSFQSGFIANIASMRL